MFSLPHSYEGMHISHALRVQLAWGNLQLIHHAHLKRGKLNLNPNLKKETQIHDKATLLGEIVTVQASGTSKIVSGRYMRKPSGSPKIDGYPNIFILINLQNKLKFV
jgi:hypothetical protein